MKPTNKKILFFDGECGLCNRSVRFLIRQDKYKHLYFAPLQGTVAQAILAPKYRQALSTVVYHRVAADGQSTLLIRSDAVLLALIDTGSYWRHLAKFIKLFPLGFRNWCYDYIANNRKKFFKKATCELPSKEEHARILP